MAYGSKGGQSKSPTKTKKKYKTRQTPADIAKKMGYAPKKKRK